MSVTSLHMDSFSWHSGFFARDLADLKSHMIPIHHWASDLFTFGTLKLKSRTKSTSTTLGTSGMSTMSHWSKVKSSCHLIVHPKGRIDFPICPDAPRDLLLVEHHTFLCISFTSSPPYVPRAEDEAVGDKPKGHTRHVGLTPSKACKDPLSMWIECIVTMVKIMEIAVEKVIGMSRVSLPSSCTMRLCTAAAFTFYVVNLYILQHVDYSQSGGALLG